MFTPLQVLALEFTDQSTRNAYVPLDLCERLKGEIGNWLSSLGDTNEDERQAKVEDHYVEAVMVVATYNMVSRFLLATDVAGLAGSEVPWPVERKEVGKLLYICRNSIDIVHAYIALRCNTFVPTCETNS